MEKAKRIINSFYLNLSKWIKKNDSLIFMFMITIVGITAKICEGENVKWIIGLICTFFVTIILYFISKEIKKLDRDQYKPKERFTHRDSYGNITVAEDRIKQAMIYLCMLEDNENEI